MLMNGRGNSKIGLIFHIVGILMIIWAYALLLLVLNLLWIRQVGEEEKI